MDTVATAVGTALARLGAGHAFGVVGSGNFTMTNALVAAGVPYLAARHEGGAATMADAYARISGRPAVLSLHQGCGLTNAMTGITEAVKSRTPVVVLAADTAHDAVRSNFRIDQPALVTAVGAVSERVHGADSVYADVLRACTTAVRDRRTVVLNVGLDVQAQNAPGPTPAEYAVPAAVRPIPDSAEVEQLADLVRRAERPVFIAGRGAWHAEAEVASAAAAAGALLATSAVAKGLFRGDPFALGIAGGFASPLSAELIAGADLLVSWGCALNMWTTRHGTLVGEHTTVVQIDDDPHALGAHRPVQLGICADVGSTAAALRAALGNNAAAGYRSADVRARIATQGRWNDVATGDISTADSIDPRVLSARLDEILPEQRTIAVDSGNFMGYPSAYLSVPDVAGFCFTQAYQSIGLGLATAIGAASARPERLCVAALGDGGFLMSVSELETAVRAGLHMLVVVYNDDAYGAEVHHFGRSANLSTVTFPPRDLAALAHGFGAEGLTVRSVRDLDRVAEWLLGDGGVLVVDARISDDGGSWWLAEAFKSH
ncbi:MAG TPA: thiamine pyrophosphate-binding protein [Jatrophihabitans sp.]|jgi:thiamine pyrophosphate-dependent acetolactate synthase large subunit-like protein